MMIIVFVNTGNCVKIVFLASSGLWALSLIFLFDFFLSMTTSSGCLLPLAQTEFTGIVSSLFVVCFSPLQPHSAQYRIPLRLSITGTRPPLSSRESPRGQPVMVLNAAHYPDKEAGAGWRVWGWGQGGRGGFRGCLAG